MKHEQNTGWISKSIHVDVDTGEILSPAKRKQNYIKLKTIKKYENNGQFNIIKYTICYRKNGQFELFT